MDFIFDPSLVLYVPLHQLDGASFMSRDAYGHLCTVTGALWRPDGRLFDGNDDQIDLSDGLPDLNFTKPATLMAWVKSTDDEHITLYSVKGADHFVIALGNNVTATLTDELISMDGKFSGTNYRIGYESADRNQLFDGGWHHVVWVFGSSAYSIYLDGQSKTVTVGAGNDDGSYNVAGATSVYIGAYPTFGSTWNFDGSIGEVLIYNRALTALEIQHNYLATKERYK